MGLRVLARSVLAELPLLNRHGLHYLHKLHLAGHCHRPNPNCPKHAKNRTGLLSRAQAKMAGLDLAGRSPNVFQLAPRR